jgi:glycosyltransferase involved in cell wall biosynthesis
MRVCVLTTSFPLYEGIAAGIHVIEKARHLVRLGVAVDVLAPHHYGAARREVIDSIQVHRFRYVLPERWQTLCYGAGIPTNLKNSLWAKLQLPLFLLAMLPNAVRLARNCDLIHAHWSLSGLVGVLAGKLLGKPVVLMMHGAEVYVLKRNPLIRFVLEQADYVLCNSSFTLERILEVSRPKAYAVVSPGVDTERFRPDVDPLIFRQREPDIPVDRPLVFALGKYIERKGFQYLIDAMASLTQAPAPFLMIGGRGPLKERLQRQAQERGIGDRVKFLDYIPDDCIPAYYGAADVFVLPSVVDQRDDTEGLGVVLLEALACGTPCVASQVGGILDIIVDGSNGFLVEPKDPIALADRISQLIADDGLRRDMGERGRLFVEENFSWQTRARGILDVYNKIVR